MRDYYELPLDDLLQQIRQYSPRTARTLAIMKDEFLPQMAFYAAFIVVCLHADERWTRSQPLVLSSSDIQTFTFFDHAHDNPKALASFEEVLYCFQAEHNAAYSA